MSEQGEKRAHRDARIIEVLLGAVLAVAVAYAGWTVNKLIELDVRLTRLETKVETKFEEFEARLSRVEERLTRIEAALNILVARKNGEAGGADAGDSKQSSLAPGQSKLATKAATAAEPGAQRSGFRAGAARE